MYLRYLKSCVLLVICTTLSAQNTDERRTGIHEAQNIYYSLIKPEIISGKSYDFSFPDKLSVSGGKSLNRKVVGWHPYWASANAYQSYDYDALTHIAYFSYEVDTATGGYSTIRDWNSTPIISYAHQRGTRVLLTVTNFGSARNTEILTDTVKQNTLLTTVSNLLKTRNGDGVNFDFESLPVSMRNNMTDFIRRAVRIIKGQIPEAEISIATPAVDWSGSWDFASLSALCDYIIVMGYDYYWRGSATAGPVAPLEGENYNVTRTINTYLTAGVAPSKLILGVPWYGYDWPVVSDARKASTTGTGTARFLSAAEALAESHGRTFDQATKSVWTPYSLSGSWRQLWFDDAVSLGHKYALVNEKDIGGIGIWALSYEGADRSAWSAIRSSFASSDSATDRIVKIYPVPTTGPGKVEFTLSAAMRVSITMYDLQGKEVIVVCSGDYTEGMHIEEFDLSNLSTGIYICVMRAGNKNSTRRVVHIKNR
jgi:spore germination protein YaaH